MPLPDTALLGHMLGAMDRLVELIARTDSNMFARDWVTQDAVIRELEVVGEAAGRLSPTFVSAHPEIPWREITGMRHKLIHDYFVVDLAIVWRTATVDIPQVAPLLRSAAANVGTPDNTTDRAR